MSYLNNVGKHLMCRNHIFVKISIESDIYICIYLILLNWSLWLFCVVLKFWPFHIEESLFCQKYGARKFYVAKFLEFALAENRGIKILVFSDWILTLARYRYISLPNFCYEINYYFQKKWWIVWLEFCVKERLILIMKKWW